MPKRTLFTNITPLPPQVSREVAVAMLHNHNEMIELNPLVVEHHPIKTPRDAPADEFLDCVWQELTDKIHYLPGGVVKGKVSYKACFHDTPTGLQTHIYAPLGLDIREKWSIGGSLPGEPPEARELGVDTPRQGLYLREDGDMRCNRMLASFVRKNLDNAHKVLVDRILKKAELVEDYVQTTLTYPPLEPNGPSQGNKFQPGSHMAKSALLNQQYQRPLSPQMLSPQQDAGWQNLANHPAFRSDSQASANNNFGPPAYGKPSHSHSQSQGSGYYARLKDEQFLQQQAQHRKSLPPAPPFPHHQQQNSGSKQFIAELPGSMFHTGYIPSPPSSDYRMSMVTELSGASSQQTPRGSPNPQTYSDRSSMVSEPAHGQLQPTYYKYGSGQDDSNEARSPTSRYSDQMGNIKELPSAPAQQQYPYEPDEYSALNRR